MTRFVDERMASFRRAPQGIRADLAELNIDGVRCVVAMPTTFMNESGQAVSPLLRYYGIERDRLLIAHDDIDLSLGTIKVQWARGHGGNNGVRSVIGSLATADFWRLRLGVGRPPGQMDPADFVLKRFPGAERDDADSAVYRAGDIIEHFVRSGGEAARQLAGEPSD